MRALVGFAVGVAVGVGVSHSLRSDLVEAQSSLIRDYRTALESRDADLYTALAAVRRAERAVAVCRAPLAPGAVVPMEVTGYGLGCDAPGPRTKAGTTPAEGWTVAADPRVLPLGSIVRIAGKGERMVQDIGGAVKGRTLDVFFHSCEQAKAFGRQVRAVEIVHLGGE